MPQPLPAARRSRVLPHVTTSRPARDFDTDRLFALAGLDRALAR
jgi:hypothetical protein